MNQKELNIIERITAPTPKFFRTLRTVGILLGTVGGVILAAPVALPAALVAAGGYIVLAGGIITAVSQTTVEDTAKQGLADKN